MIDENALLENFDACKYALMIEGVMSKPTQYYTISNNDEMEEAVINKGIQMMDSIGVNANVTVSAPLVN